MSAVLDLNDAHLTLYAGEHATYSPGYALFQQDRYYFGDTALKQARRAPQHVHTRFWSQLSTQGLNPAFGPVRHTADLVHKHLSELLRSADSAGPVLIVAPGSMAIEQLSLLLGIAQAVPMEIAGVVHRSAVLGAAAGISNSAHIELQLHQALITPLSRDSANVQAGSSNALPGLGLLALFERSARAISQAFINQTRFDPQRSAESEQALYDALPEVLATLSSYGETSLNINGYQARLTRELLEPVGQHFSNTIASALPAQIDSVLVDPMLANLPGFKLDSHTRIVEHDVIPVVVRENLDQLRQSPQNLSFRASVPARATEELIEPPTFTDTPESIAPTHILINHSAHPIAKSNALEASGELSLIDGQVRLGSNPPPDLMINDKPAQGGQLLVAGDLISDSLGFEAKLIVVEP